MRKLQNTLYITTQGSYLHKEREMPVVEICRTKLLKKDRLVGDVEGLFV